MGSDSVLGLLFRISADPSQAQAALDQFSAATGKAFQQASTDGPPKLDTSLLSNRESVRLLSEEMGIHLPRAVSSAVAEMIPAISAIGPTLLGAFAVDELYKFSKGLKGLYDDFDGVTQAAKDMAGYVRENESALEGLARANIKVAQSELLRVQIGAAKADAVVSELQATKDLSETYFGPMAAALSFVTGQTREYDDALKDANAQHELAKKLALIVSQDEVKGQKDAARAAKEHAEAIRETLREEARGNEYINEQLAKWAREDEARLHKEAEFNAEMVREKIKWERDWDRLIKQDAKEEAEALRALNREMREMPMNFSFLQGSLQKAVPQFHTFKTVIQELTGAQDAQNKGLAASAAFVALNAASILETLGAKREYAALMTIYEAAEGFKALGSYDFWGAAQDFASSAMYAKVAGTGGGHHGAAGAGAGAGAGSGAGGGGGGAGPGVLRGGGGASGGGGGGGYSQGTIVVTQGNLCPGCQQQFFAQAAIGQGNGLFKISASSVSSIPAPRA